MKSIKVCEYSRSRSFHDDLILQDQASGERSQDQWYSGLIFAQNIECGYMLEQPPRGEAVLTNTHDLCFGAKIRKLGIPLYTPVLLLEK